MIRVSGRASSWVRRRLGAAGTARLRVRDRVAEPLAEATQAVECRIGFTDDELSRFSEAHRLDAIASAFEGRGDTARLRRIAWWGSALADLALVDTGTARERVLAEGAAFNLAVALFDSVVDDGMTDAARLAHALEPARMSARLSEATNEQTRLSCEGTPLRFVVGLFDLVLASAGDRLRAWPGRLAHLSAQLEQMYRSELGLAPDPFVAKTGPVVFIGMLASDRAVNSRLYDSLARFCHEWDDWQDMADDMPRFAPNVFLGKPLRRLSAAGAAYATRSTWRLMAGSLLHVGIAEHLASSLQDVVDVAKRCDRSTYSKTLALCRELVS